MRDRLYVAFVAGIGAVLFDADGVVQFWRDDSEMFARFSKDHAWSEERFERIKIDIYGSEQFGADCLTGAADWPSHVAKLLATCDWRRTVDEFLEVWLGWATLVSQDALRLVSELRSRGITCALATNQEAWRARHMDNRLGYTGCFDALFYSCRIGHKKPDPAFFEAVVGALEIAPDEALFIDDSEVNVLAARAYGLHAELLRPGDDLRATVERYGLLGP